MRKVFAITLAFLATLIFSPLSWATVVYDYDYVYHGPYPYHYLYSSYYRYRCETCRDDRYDSAVQAVRNSQEAMNRADREISRTENTYRSYGFNQRVDHYAPIADTFARKLSLAEEIYSEAQREYQEFLTRHAQDLRIWRDTYDRLFRPIYQNLTQKVGYSSGYAQALALAIVNQQPPQRGRDLESLPLPQDITPERDYHPLRGEQQSRVSVYASQAAKKAMADFYNCVVVEGGVYGYWQSDTFVTSDPGDALCQKGQCTCETIL